jgi:hypothetical protein
LAHLPAGDQGGAVEDVVTVSVRQATVRFEGSRQEAQRLDLGTVHVAAPR